MIKLVTAVTAVTIAVLLIVTLPVAYAVAQNDITITLNNIEIQFEQPPIMRNDRVLAPLDTIKEALNIQIHWNDEEKIIILRSIYTGRNHYYSIDSPTSCLIGDDKIDDWVSFGVPPAIINGHVYIPVRNFAELSGYNVDWDENTWTVAITKLTHVEGLTVEITYLNNEGDGQAPPPQVFPLGKNVQLARLYCPSDLRKLDHTFDGWLDPVNGILYFEGETVSFDSDVILYATFTNVFNNKTVW